MKRPLPSEAAIAQEMREAGLDRFPAIRRIQQRRALIRKVRQERRASR